jgi:adenylate cyclase
MAQAWLVAGWLKIWVGEPPAAIACFEHAMRLSPLDTAMPRMQDGIAHAHFFAGRYDEASEWAARLLHDLPYFHDGLRISAASNALAGKAEAAHAAIARLLQLDPELRVSTIRARQGPYCREEDHLRYEEALRRAGLPE